MKILTACAVLALLLSGCIAVPVAPVPGPAAYYYAPPPVSVQFGYTYHGGGWRHGRGHWH